MKLRIFLSLAWMIALSACGGKLPAATPKMEAAKPDVRLTLLPEGSLTPGKPVTVVAKLMRIEERTVIAPDELAMVHTQKFHLLLIDPTLTDYRHIHPTPMATPGLYQFTVTPKLSGGYRAWADVTLKDRGTQEFAMADLGARRAGAIDKTETHAATVDGYRFTLSFDTPPVAGGESMGTIRVQTADGQPVNTLEPVMGAYAHIVGFYSDFHTIVHTHPMGEEPKADNARGGPELMFHLEPKKSGFIKLFAEVKIDGKELYAPFGVMVRANK